jgi:uncharacterized repeat protein (TIGR03803 family)
LVQDVKGNLYGTTAGSEASGQATVFKLGRTGKLTTLHVFCSARNCSDGDDPNGVIQDAKGNLYGTTNLGGDSNCGEGFGCGLVFRLTP